MCCIPIIKSNGTKFKVLGVLEVFRSTVDEFTEKEEKLLENVVNKLNSFLNYLNTILLAY